MRIRVADYIASRLADYGVRHVFLVTGGGAMFLNDALGHHPDIEAICNHHEQASAMAAEGYARIAGEIGVINVTTGPGGINALNGVFGAWTDSIPMLVLSGQVKRETCLGCHDLPGLRQLGDQEVDIVAMARPITKYCEQVRDPETVALHLDRALHLATSGRPGPCWLDIPIDVQSAWIDSEQLARHSPVEDDAPWQGRVDTYADLLIERIRQARRPVIMAGTGIRCARAEDAFLAAVRALNIPVVTAWTHDIIASDDPLFCGRPGTIGTRAGNFTVQNADLLIVLGSRLNIRQTSYNWKSFAHRAEVIQVDIDAAELNKPTYRPSLGLVCDLGVLLPVLAAKALADASVRPEHQNWLAWCRERLERYPNVTDEQREFRGRINPYHFIDRLFELLDEQDIIACGNATACIVPFQVARLKLGQRLFSNSGSASMGYDLPAAIGAWFGAVKSGRNPRRIVCLAGDGSLQMNIQELQTVAHHRIPIKILVLDNRGYLSIRSSQNNFFGRRFGESDANGVSFPDFVRVAEAFGIPAQTLNGPDFESLLAPFLDAEGPGLSRVLLDDMQGFEPRMSSKQLPDGTLVSPPLEDMFPFLDRSELEDNIFPEDAGCPFRGEHKQ